MEESLTAQKNITDKWLGNLYEYLIRLEAYEKLMITGCENLVEFIENPNPAITLSQIQEKNYSLFMTEFIIVLNNVKEMIGREEYLNIIIRWKQVREKEIKLGGFLRLISNEVNHYSHYELKPEFYSVILKVSGLRAMLVKSLWKYLTPSAEEAGGLPK